jgi:hypothetical protein
MPSRKRHTKTELRIVFDTNAIWTGSTSDLVKQEIKELIQSHSNHADVSMVWYMPDIVRHERQFQILQKGLELLPSVQKLERLLGHNLNITEEIIRERANSAVERQIEELGINTIRLDPGRVDWANIMLNAAYRVAPFGPGEKEKGFRDSLVAESFLQLVTESPSTPSVCRLVLVTADSLLQKAVALRTQESPNVKIISDLDGLQDFINTLVSEVTEEFVNRLRDRASLYFFEKKNLSTLYFKENIKNKITGEIPGRTDGDPSGRTFA